MENKHPENLTPETQAPQSETLEEPILPQTDAEDAGLPQPETEEDPPVEEGYVPRPAWQVWMARVGLVLFILVVILYYLNMMRSGL